MLIYIYFVIIYASGLTAFVSFDDSISQLEHYCYVQSPKSFTSFNLTTIQNDNYDSSIRINDLEYLKIHFCKPLKDPCNGKQDYAVCLHSKDKEIGIGREPPKVAVEFGKIMFRYMGDKCNYTHNYTVDVEMKCNFSVKEKLSENLDVLYNRDNCDFQMSIETTAACGKGIQTICDVKNESGYFNLKPLMDLANNYIIKLNRNISVILNVCHSLIYGQHYSQCTHDTMVCLLDESNASEPSLKRLGNINNQVRISASNGSVYLDLTSDTPCDQEDADEQKTIRTTLEFVCDLNAINNWPEYTSGLGTCHYKFTWLTAAACSEDILIEQSEVNHQSCEIMDPLYDQLFDLSMLKGNDAYVKSQDRTAEYQFSVCSPLRKSNCTKEGTGVCKYIKGSNVGVSKGLANSNLGWRGNQIFLNYTDGVACGNYQRSYTTIIFKCDFRNYVTVDEPNSCATIITWKTPMICDHRCSTSDFKYNFNQLRMHLFNYHATGGPPGTDFYMNVCEPLADDNFTICTYGTGICKVVVDGKGNRISETNLGYAENGIRTAPDGRIYVRYVNGSTCEEDPTKRISSEITFTCDEDFQAIGDHFLTIGDSIFTTRTLTRYFDYMQNGLQRFKDYNNCKYDFNWKTHNVCPDDTKIFSEVCVLQENIKKFDLSLLIENHNFKINANESTGYFNGSACGDLKKCHGTFVCDNQPKDINTPKLDRLPTLVVFKFENKAECKTDSFINAWLNVWCHVYEGSAESFLVKEEECSIGLDWNNSVSFCELNSSFSNAGTVILTVVAVLTLIIIIIILYCCRNRERRILCMYSTCEVMARYMRCIFRIREVEGADDDVPME